MLIVKVGSANAVTAIFPFISPNAILCIPAPIVTLFNGVLVMVLKNIVIMGTLSPKSYCVPSNSMKAKLAREGSETKL